MVLLFKLCSHPLEACLNSETRRAILFYALVKGWSLNVGKIEEQSILDYAENNFSGNIPHPSLITLLCIKGSVTFNETEEKCPRPSPLTLTGVLKTLAQCEQVEKARKRKRAYTNFPREEDPTVEEEPETEEIWGFEDYPKQPMLSPSAAEILLAQNIAERGKRRAEEQESSTYELFSLLTEMREEMSSSRKR